MKRGLLLTLFFIRLTAFADCTITIQPAMTVRTIDSTFLGLSYEKANLSKPVFSSGNSAMIALLNRLGPAVFRFGGNTVEGQTWDPNGTGGVNGMIAPSDVDRLAGLIQATQWKVLYGINLGKNTPSLAASEAMYVSQALGDRLFGFEIGNEPDLYYSNGLRPTTYTYLDYKSEWELYAAAIRAQVPNAVLTGPASASNFSTYTGPFANDEKNNISLLTQHYYRTSGQLPTSTIDLLLAPHPGLMNLLGQLSSAAKQISGGYRMAECNSFSHGGAMGISDAFGTALWTIDFLFENVMNDSQGVNFHGGGDGPTYTPIANNPQGTVDGVRPVYYGMYVFSMAANGGVLQTTLNGCDPTVNFSAYATKNKNDGSLSVILSNKSRTQTVNTTLSFDHSLSNAKSLLLSAPSLDSQDSYTLGGSAISNEGYWKPVNLPSLPVSNNTVAVVVAPGTAQLIHVQ